MVRQRKIKGKGTSTYRSLDNDFDRVKFLSKATNADPKQLAALVRKPETTVRRWQTRVNPPGKRGPPSYLSDQEEAQLVDIISAAAGQHRAMSVDDIRAQVSLSQRCGTRADFSSVSQGLPARSAAS